MSLIFATQLTAAATTVLAVFAIVTAVFAIFAFRKQSKEVSDQAEMLRVQSEQFAEQRRVNEEQLRVLALQAEELRESLKQRERDTDERHRSQGAKVTAWMGGLPGTTGTRHARIRNASDLPIFDVRAFFHRINEKPGHDWEVVDQGKPSVKEIRVFPPQEDRYIEAPDNVQGLAGILVTDRNCVVSIEFTDAAGNQWERDPRGALVPRS